MIIAYIFRRNLTLKIILRHKLNKIYVIYNIYLIKYLFARGSDGDV